MDGAKKRNKALHLMGLLSDGQVHSSQQHLYALLRMAKERGLQRVFVHCFLDGRDTPPASATDYVAALQRKTEETGCGEIATLIGRYYAMDRDKRWERTHRAMSCWYMPRASLPRSGGSYQTVLRARYYRRIYRADRNRA